MGISAAAVPHTPSVQPSSHVCDCRGDREAQLRHRLLVHRRRRGLRRAIMLFVGKDATEEFDMLHDRKVIKKYGLDQGTVQHMCSLTDVHVGFLYRGCAAGWAV